MVELALVLPIFLAVLVGIISLGIGVFYQQQVTNAAREAARYASIHSATARCPTASRLVPQPKPSDHYFPCDDPDAGWPLMTDAGRRQVYGLPRDDVVVAACWSGYIADGDPGKYDAPPTGAVVGLDTTWSGCSIDGHDPNAEANAIGCSSAIPSTTVDTASDLSEAPGRVVGNQVTVYACYVWRPPLAGFLLIPSEITLRGVVSEPIQRQQ
jgi:hypothetical protein